MGYAPHFIVSSTNYPVSLILGPPNEVRSISALAQRISDSSPLDF